MSTFAITNIGHLVSGDINAPVIDADTLIIKDGLIEDIGSTELLGKYELEKTIDAGGMTVTPGLIDSHAHILVGEYTPRHDTVGYIGKMLNGGVTSIISAGESHAPGRPTDPAGTKALAIFAHKSYENHRPSGVKVHGGAVILEKGLTEEDFIEMEKAGVNIVGEIGLGSAKKPEDAGVMVKWAKKHGFTTQLHTGGTSVPGSSCVSSADVLGIDPDVISHLNGGPTSIPQSEIDEVIEADRDFALELVQCGNFKNLVYVVKKAKEVGKLDKIIIGNDSPSGTGVITLGIIRTAVFIASMCEGISPEVAIAMASGNTAKRYHLNTGVIAKGKEADLVIMDAPPGSVANDAMGAMAAGDIPGVSTVLIDGEIKVTKSNTTPPANRKITIK